jgi:hypothetical protein
VSAANAPRHHLDAAEIRRELEEIRELLTPNATTRTV